MSTVAAREDGSGAAGRSIVRRLGRVLVPLPVRLFAWWLVRCGPPLPVSRWRFAGPWQWPSSYRGQPVRRLEAAAHQRVHFALRRTTSRYRPLPDYIGIGVTKAGTGSMHAYLREHPQVAPPVRKEIRFFHDHHYGRGEGWYRAHFPLAAQRAGVERRLGLPTFTGEVSPGYLHGARVPERVAALMPSARIILLLRDPTERAVSHHEMLRRHGEEDRPFHDLVRAALSDPDRAPTRTTRIIEAGYYARHLRRWYDHFPREQILIVPTERLTRDGATGFEQIVSFIGLEPMAPPRWERNVGTYHEDHSETRTLLREHYHPYNEELWDLIGDRWDWPSPA